MPNTAYIQQAVTTTQQNQTTTNHDTNNVVDFTKTMKEIIYARQLEIMRGSIGF